MEPGTAITPELRESVGRSVGPFTFEVEKGAITRFTDAVGDAHPGDILAPHRRTPQGAIIAPPGFFGWPVNGSLDILDILAEFHCPFKRVLNGGTECEFHRPVHPGDVLSATRRLADVSEKDGQLGKLIILVIETTYVNQRGQLVAVNRDTTITY